jgi:hypothetical protein
MDFSMQTTDEFDSAGTPAPGEATAETRVAPLSISRERCSGCGATLASDQRYCVECGQRCGAPRLPFTEGLVHAQQSPSSRPPFARPRVSMNNTVIAGIGTLLLAMGIGVLIGRSGTASSVKSASPAVQVVTVPGAGAAAASTESQTSTSAAGTTKSKGASGGASTAKSTSHTSKKAAAPPAKTVTVGSPGKGAGYQKGHFTGNFFGE